MSKYNQGMFRCRNPEKYDGNPLNIVWRSSWELKFFMWLDKNSDVISWQSEEFIVPYVDMVTKTSHRYFPDVIMKVKQKDGSIKTIMVEIKPFDQTTPPKKPEKQEPKKMQRFLTEIKTYGKNISKWQAAERYCSRKDWSFQIITEKNSPVRFV